MNYFDFHKNRVRYNINTTNEAKSKILLFRYLNCIINYKMIKINNNNNNNKYLVEESCTFFSYEVFKLIILLFPLKGFR